MVRLAGSSMPTHRLLARPRPFVGGERELTEVADLPNDPAGPLPALPGRGSLDRTRLVREAVPAIAAAIRPSRSRRVESASRPRPSTLRPVIDVLLVLGLLSAACAGSSPGRVPAEPTATPPQSAATSAVPRPGASAATARPAGRNPFGLMLPSRLVRSSQGMRIAQALGATYFRPSAIFLDQWNGTCQECDIAQDAGLQLVLTVRNSGPLPTAPPSDLAAYQRRLGEVLDRYRPAVLAVENEENSTLFYTGTPEDYAAQLKAACQVAHQKGIPCTNGGLVSTLVALLAYDHYRESGQTVMAQDFAVRAFTPEERRLLNSPEAQEQLRKGKALLAASRTAGVDYVNVHWYIADPRALEEAVVYLRAQTGLPVMTNEIGQFTDDPNQTTAVMGKVVELGLPIAVWFGLDGPKARGLVDPDGKLRPTGEAFQRFIAQSSK